MRNLILTSVPLASASSVSCTDFTSCRSALSHQLKVRSFLQAGSFPLWSALLSPAAGPLVCLLLAALFRLLLALLLFLLAINRFLLVRALLVRSSWYFMSRSPWQSMAASPCFRRPVRSPASFVARALLVSTCRHTTLSFALRAEVVGSRAVVAALVCDVAVPLMIRSWRGSE